MDIIPVKISTQHLAEGISVLELDRPWLETPFAFQGFTISDDDDIKLLQKYCQYIMVNRTTVPESLRVYIIDEVKAAKVIEIKPETEASGFEIDFSDETTFVDELQRAESIADNLLKTTQDMFEGLIRGDKLELEPVRAVVMEMVDSIIRNPDAMAWLVRVKDRDEYTFRHSIGCTVWSATLGRQLGLNKKNLQDLSMGAMMCDIGKTKVDKGILEKKTRLTPEEFEAAKHHVQYSLDLLKEAGEENEDIISVVANHHERHNGQGYPQGLRGQDIPVFGRIAAIADCYDAMISHRVFQKAISPSKAIKKLYEWRDYDFQGQMVEVFIQAVGVYPTGSVVELSDGRVAIVLAEGRKNRLLPTVLVILDNEKNPILQPIVVNLAASHRASKQKTKPLFIKDSLPNDAYGIDPTAYNI